MIKEDPKIKSLSSAKRMMGVVYLFLTALSMLLAATGIAVLSSSKYKGLLEALGLCVAASSAITMALMRFKLEREFPGAWERSEGEEIQPGPTQVAVKPTASASAQRCLLGDLNEELPQVRERYGVLLARLWYIHNVLSIAPWLISSHVSRRLAAAVSSLRSLIGR